MIDRYMIDVDIGFCYWILGYKINSNIMYF